MKKIRLLLLIVMAQLYAATANAQLLAVNTDVAMDACLAPSLG